MRGRNICMGYFKNPQDTAKTIDVEGFLHSGDLGRLKVDTLFITGRAKELIITAGGENIPPILIENEIKNALPCISNVMAIGDHRKFLTCLLSLKEDPPLSGNLDKVSVEFLAGRGCPIKTVKEAVSNPAFRKVIQ
jgi:long-chain-fatty-acid--CoA ligase ACSBG